MLRRARHRQPEDEAAQDVHRAPVRAQRPRAGRRDDRRRRAGVEREAQVGRMPRVIGIDPGTLTIDLCGLEHGRVFLDRSVPTAEALADPTRFVALLAGAGPLDCIAGPSGYGLPLTPAQQATEEDLRLAFLAAGGEAGGIGGLRALARALGKSGLPVFFTPGVIHLRSAPAHRKANRLDMGTPDTVCAAALALGAQSP